MLTAEHKFKWQKPFQATFNLYLEHSGLLQNLYVPKMLCELLVKGLWQSGHCSKSSSFLRNAFSNSVSELMFIVTYYEYILLLRRWSWHREMAPTQPP